MGVALVATRPQPATQSHRMEQALMLTPRVSLTSTLPTPYGPIVMSQPGLVAASLLAVPPKAATKL